jgi:hypothetical protein
MAMSIINEEEFVMPDRIDPTGVHYTYDAEGERIDEMTLDADRPTIVLKDGTVAAAEELGSTTYRYDLPGDAPDAERYAWEGRELDYDPDLQYNRVHGTPDLTPGRFIETE